MTPIYDVYNTETKEYETEYGEEYTIRTEFDFVYVDIDVNGASDNTSEEYGCGIVLDMIVGKDIRQ